MQTIFVFQSGIMVAPTAHFVPQSVENRTLSFDIKFSDLGKLSLKHRDVVVEPIDILGRYMAQMSQNGSDVRLYVDQSELGALINVAFDVNDEFSYDNDDLPFTSIL